jgi:cell division transport system permease protein
MRGLLRRLRPRRAQPRARDRAGPLHPWMVALMVYLAALASAGMMALHGVVQRWDSTLAGTLTAVLPPEDLPQLEKVLQALRATPGVISVDVFDDAASARLLEPWLGPNVRIDELQLPRLIDVRADPALGIDRTALALNLAKLASGIRLSDDRRWLDPLFATAFAAEALAVAIVLLVAGAAVLSVVFATRTSLAIHQSTIEVLHLIGARDSYIAGQFQWQALHLALRGSVLGLALAGVTLLLLGEAQAGGDALGAVATALPPASLAPLQWVLLLLLAPAASLAALATARLTVLRALARMP